MREGREFIFPENVDRSYGIWKDYTLKDFGYMTLTGGLGLLLIILPSCDLASVLTKIVIIVLAMTIVMAILTIRPVNVRKDIKVRDYLEVRSQYVKSQKLYFLKPQKWGDIESEPKKITTK